MKVKIIKCSDSLWWYNNKIGQVFEVSEYKAPDGDHQVIINGKASGEFINSDDFEIVEENVAGLATGSTTNDRTIKMSLDTAREWYNAAKQLDPDGVAIKFLKENFTKEELEGNKGYSWEESFSGNGGYYITLFGDVGHSLSTKKEDSNKNLFRTKEQAESALAFAQLSHIVAKYNDNKYFKTSNGKTEYYYVTCFNGVDLGINSFTVGQIKLHLPFCDFEDAKTSLEVNKDLWEKYWMLGGEFEGVTE